MALAPNRWSAWAARASGSLIGLAGVLRRAPLTVALVAVLWVVGAATGSLVNGPAAELLAVVGVGPDALAQGRWWTPLTSAVWCADLGGYLTASVLLLLVLAVPAERRLGVGRVGLLLFVAQVAGTVIGSGVVWLASFAGDRWAEQISHGLVVGPGGAAVGVGMAFSCRISTLWRCQARR
jgi:phosphatidylglycerol lysyltransferase